tara:strand:- start:248 stop:1702 length:1455 start_codon:yes stop_codon:yes gene_type:complete
MKLKRFKKSLTPIHKPYNFQAEAFEAIKDKEYFGVFHEQGLGKTKIAIDLALHWLEKEECDSVVFVTKKSLVENWKSEILNHTSHFPIIFSPNKKKNYASFHSAAYLFICHYDLIRNDLEGFISFCKLRKIGMILDESVAIKNPQSQVSISFHELSKHLIKRIIMTGTPVDNRPQDIWSQVFFLDFGRSLGNSYSTFKDKYDLKKELSESSLIQLEYKKNLYELREKLADFTLRETKETAKINLPNKEFRRIEVSMDERQREIYEKVRKELFVEIIKNGKLEIEEFDFVAVRLLRLIQVSSYPALFDESYSREAPKLTALKELISEINDSEKIIIWTNYIKTSESLLKELGSSAVLINGNLDLDIRNKNINRFKTDEKVRFLIATYGTAKEGLTLTVANHAIFFERNFSLSDYLQAQDRIHRISQKKKSFIYNIYTKDSAEDWLEALVSAKESAAKFVQGDIDEDEFTKKIRYDYGDILEKILN